MRWIRGTDPAFYQKEPYVLRTHAEIPRYAEDAQVEVRLEVLRTDWLLRVATAIVGVAAYALIAIPAVWTRFDAAVLGVSAIVTVLLFRVRGRLRGTLAALAIGLLFALHTQPISVAPLVGMLAAGVSLVGSIVVEREWRARPQVVTWAAFAALLLVCAFAILFSAPVVEMHLPVEIATIAVAYLCVCIIAGRLRRAELLARPEGVLSLPQSIVPLLERSHDHAIICWLV